MCYILQGDDIQFPDARVVPELETQFPALITTAMTPEMILRAYRMGYFPWFNPGEPIQWWCPDPRYVLLPNQVIISKSMRSVLRNAPWEIRIDTSFRDVMEACGGASLGRKNSDTWVSPLFISVYGALHDQGYAHSVEVWEGDQLIAGLYGVALGRVFFGESMFTHRTNASKYAFIHLCKHLVNWGFNLIDCQMPNAHLDSLGAVPMSRIDFLNHLEKNASGTNSISIWPVAQGTDTHKEHPQSS